MIEKNIKFIFTICFVLLIIASIFIMIKTSKVLLENNTIKITGIYGTSIPIEDIVEVKMIDSLPLKGRRTNGLSFGSIRLGYFNYAELGRVKLCILKKEAPYILVISKDQKVIIGLGKEKNEKLYNELKK